MQFISLDFLIFLGVFLTIYFLTSRQVRLTWVVLTSYFFYGWWDWRFLPLMFLISVMAHQVGLRMAASCSNIARKIWLSTGIASGLLTLGFFKYFNFFSNGATSIAQSIDIATNFTTLDIVLPVGISFYTFHVISYMIDVYNRKLPAERNLLIILGYIALFPQLVAGPIVRASALVPSLRIDHRLEWSNIVRGTELILWGLFLKTCVADNLAPYADTVFGEPSSYSPLALLLGVLFFTFQIYGDFAGYSNIAIGLGRIMGYDLGVNFNRPYFATSMSKFWKRWHISLSSFLRDYLYISLGGDRKGIVKTYRNLFITMIFGGLWHGASWTFVIWGALHGFYLVVQRLLSPCYAALVERTGLPKVLSDTFCMAVVFVSVSFAWIFFRAPGIEIAIDMISGMMKTTGWSFATVPLKIEAMKGLMVITLLICLEALSLRNLARAWYTSTLRPVAIAAQFWIISFIGAFHGNQFIYFQF